MQEVGGENASGLRVQELPPGRAVPSGRRVDARGAQDLVDGRGRDGQAQLGQLTVNAPVTPERVLARQADGEPGDAADRRGPAGLAPFAGVVFSGGEFAVPGQQRRRRHGEDLGPAPPRDEPGERGEPVGFLNSATGVELGFYAARSYSLMRPPRTGRRLICSHERSAAGWSGCGGGGGRGRGGGGA